MTRPLLAAVALVVVTAGPIGVAGCGSDRTASTEPSVEVFDPATLPSLMAMASTPPANPWAVAADQAATAAQAGLVMYDGEVTTVHYHAHLDLMIRGEPVMVPSHIGMDHIQGTMSPLHTHDASGVVHIESPEDVAYTLGQLFTEWGQPLGPTQIGPIELAKGEALLVYRNGKRVTGNPAAITFVEYAEYFVWVGPAGSPPSKPPATYKFSKGL